MYSSCCGSRLTSSGCFSRSVGVDTRSDILALQSPPMRIAAIAIVCLTGTAYAQVDRRYAEEPTDGVGMPTAPMAGEFDGRVVATNPGGLPLVRGAELA